MKTTPNSELRTPKEIRSPKPKLAAGARDLSRFTADFTGALRDASVPLRFVARSGLKSALRCALAVCLLTSVFCPLASAQYAIDWHSIDGGGGTSTGGVYTVSGTIGQPDAGTMSGGNYTLQGGFWGAIAAGQTTGAPLLSIFRTTTNTVAVSWPSASTGWNLQQNTNSVSSVNWSNVTSGIQDDGTIKTFIVNPPAGNRFYRLHKP